MTLSALFLALLLFHLVYDFHIQGDYISRGKSQSNTLLGVHALTWALVVYVPLYFYFHTINWPVLISLFVVHYIVDWFKARGHSDRLAQRLHLSPMVPLWLDQLIHMAQLVVAVYLMGGFGVR